MPRNTSAKAPHIKSVAIENFKALRHSGSVKLKPLTVLIGNNGSGKSSLVEAIETYRRIVMEGADAAMEHWQGMEHIRHKAAVPRLTTTARVEPGRQQNAMEFTLKLATAEGAAELNLELNTRENGNLLYIQHEQFLLGKEGVQRNALGVRGRNSVGFVNSPVFQADLNAAVQTLSGGQSLLPYLSALRSVTTALRQFLFLRLNPETIGSLQPLKRSGGRVQLSADGSNVAEYLIDLRERSPSAFDSVIQAVRFVLPYAADVEPRIVDAGVIRRGYVQLLEGAYEIPGWLMSWGSLRVLPLIATLLDPDPPPVVFVEELENGLDPRTVGLLVDLMRDATASGRTQVIATTHSPYLLDLLGLDDVLLCERTPKGPAFTWPADNKDLAHWRDRFQPGKLYTMRVLQQAEAGVEPDSQSKQGEAPEGGWGEAQ